ncbi:hypothetical protein HJ01_02834 [Flavobacterium frigoris PS1]|uniref:Uncharacterized protein n=1 Tax=Flavobacterium frigoris (strain PS1) TaxID=1086011 RepID=H7FUL9_FLAFP|nr:hypothetical protein HJ01_02834 [Flavobacterium frigoris PS1]
MINKKIFFSNILTRKWKLLFGGLLQWYYKKQIILFISYNLHLKIIIAK